MTKKTQPTNHGSTLLEVILYLAILSTLVFGIASFVNLISVSRVKSQTMTEVDQQAFQIIGVITEAIRNAESINVPAVGQEQESLTLLDSENNTINFSLDGNNITINRGVGNVNLNNDRVIANNLSFKNLSRINTPDIIQINFTLTSNNSSNNQIYNYSKTYVATSRLFK